MRDAINTPTDDPLLAVSAMAAATQRVGSAVTVCSTYERPYAFTRKMTTLAHIRASQRGGTGAVEDRAPPAWASVTQRAVAAIAYEVESVDAETRVVLQPELVANEQLPPVARDPRVSAALESPLRPEE
ncbi:hypothetical protein [Actinacidiphila oryziradicis]|uniref:hypothetical protein n=1 Tax=Actinacidiphila oryziradicis TaxID=2571141 RepID=UPI001FE894C4|nr:hypothetical protein [Actinacidiphila oryziradicis]